MKRNRKTLISAIALVWITAGFLFYLKFYYPSNQDTILHRVKIGFYDENYISVRGDGVKIMDDKIKVVWSSDFVKDKVIWEKGKHVGTIENEYGPQGFSVYYSDQLIGHVTHMKTNNWHTHSYRIKLKFLDANHTMGFDFRADGPNRLSLDDVHLD